MSIRIKILAGFLLVLAVAGLITVTAVISLRSVDQSIAHTVKTGFPGYEAASDISRTAAEISSLVKSYVITGDAAILAMIATAKATSNDNLQRAAQLAPDPEDKALVEEVRQAVLSYRSTCQRAIYARKAGEVDRALLILNSEVDASYEQLKGIVDKFLEHKHAEATSDYDTMQATSRRAMLSILIFLGLGGILVGATAWLLSGRLARPLARLSLEAERIAQGDLALEKGFASGRTVDTEEAKAGDDVTRLEMSFSAMTANLRNMIQQLQENAVRLGDASRNLAQSADETGQATQSIAATVDELSRGIMTQARDSERGLELVAEIGNRLAHLAAGLTSIAETAVSARKLAENGTAAVSVTTSVVVENSQATQRAMRTIASLVEQSARVSTIAETITALSEQTNLLALNAAIEAARAGQHGRGFAIVADEVRKLAEESRQSAKEIAAIVADIQSAADEASQDMTSMERAALAQKEAVLKTTASLEAIVASVEEISDHVTKSAEASEDVNQRAASVIELISHIASVARESSAATEEVSASIQEQAAATQEVAALADSVARTATDLEEIVARFRL